MDDRLRKVERGARADAQDLAAGRALVRARERASDRLGAWRARCRLARAGDEDAWRELSARAPGPRRLGPPFVRALGEVRRVYQANEDGLLAGGDREGSAASPVLLLDPITLEPRWSTPTGGQPAALLGPLAIYAQGQELVACDALTGAVQGRAALPGPLFQVRGRSADGALVVDLGTSHRATTTVALDMADTCPRAGEPWRERRAYTMGLVRGARLVVGSRGRPPTESTLARTLTTNRVRWRAPGRPLALDASHVLMEVSPDLAVERVALVAGASGEVAWEARVDLLGPSAALTDDAVVLASNTHRFLPPSELLEVVALDRRTGDVRWRLREEVGPHVVADVAAARDVVIVAHGPLVAGERSPFTPLQRVTLSGLNPASGARLWALTPDVLEPHRGAVVFVVEGAVVAWVRGHLVRLAEP